MGLRRVLSAEQGAYDTVPALLRVAHAAGVPPEEVIVDLGLRRRESDPPRTSTLAQLAEHEGIERAFALKDWAASVTG